ncbi:MAG: hypothetical protein M1818_004180 [Claussenomyces sp. TS43310]|nr:MAG: hypothetical protein M1818_004180 [Claussenomyces sp. TS43310]
MATYEENLRRVELFHGPSPMADVPQRVNAAQLAARKIKTTGSLRKKLGNHKSDDGNSVPLFAQPNASFSSSAGLFGGTVNATGGFNFSAPGPSISFASPSGSNTPTQTSNNEDPRADTTGEEAARRNKPFRVDTESAPQQTTNPFQMPSASVFGQPNGSSTSSFPAPQSPVPSSGFSFGSTSTSNDPVNKSFSFGQSAQAQPSSTPFTFGPKPTKETTPSNPFSFGPKPTQEPISSDLFSFGQGSTRAASPAITFGTTPSQEKPSNATFSFGQTSGMSQPASTGISFGSAPALEKPPNAIFNFGQTSATPQPAPTGVNFGSTPATDKPSRSSFSFGQASTASQPTSSSANVGCEPAKEKANGNLFAFGQTASQAQPTGSGTSFGKAPAVATPKSNLFAFGQNQAKSNSDSPSLSFGQPSTGIFGQSLGPTQMSNPFGQQREQSITSNGTSSSGKRQEPNGSITLENQTSQPPKPASNLLNSHNNTPTTTLFGAKAPAPTNKITENHTRQAPSTSLFGGQREYSPQKETSPQREQSPASSSVFGKQASSNEIFGSQKHDQTKNLFGSISSPKTASPAATNVFGIKAQQSTPFNVFAKPAHSEFQAGALNPLPSASPQVASEGDGSTRPLFSSLRPQSASTTTATDSSIFDQRASNDESAEKSTSDKPVPNGILGDSSQSTQNSMPSSYQPPKNSLFSPTKIPDGLRNANQSAHGGLFPNLQAPSQSDTNNIFTKSDAVQQAFPAPTDTSMSLQRTADPDKPIQSVEKVDKPWEADVTEIGKIDEELMETRVPERFTAAQKAEFRGAYSIRALNAGLQSFLSSLPMGADYSKPLEFYKKRRNEIATETQKKVQAFKRKANDSEVQLLEQSPNKRSKQDPATSLVQSPAQGVKTSTFQSNSNVNTPQTVPSPEKHASTALSSFLSPVKLGNAALDSTTPRAPPPAAPQFFAQQSATIGSPSAKGKRKAEVQLTKDDPTGVQEDTQRRKHAKLKGSAEGSQTSNIFKNILDSGSSTSSPEKKMFPLEKASEKIVDTPKRNPFASLPIPPQSSSSSASKAPPISFAPGAPAAALPESGFAPRMTGDPPAQSVSYSDNTPSADQGPTAAVTGSFAPTTAESLSKTNAARLNTVPAGDSPTDILGQSAAPSNAADSTLSATNQPETTNTNLFSPKATSTSKNFFQFKPATSSPLANSFTPPFSASAAKPPAPAATASNGIKPPTFGGSANFLTQFGQQAQKDKEDAEKKAMERARLEDMDSDDDEAEWEANYMKKREEEKKALEDLAKSKRAAFVPGKGFSFGDPSKSADPVQSEPKPLFTPSSRATSSNSIFTSSNTAPASNTNPFASRSGTSSPAAASSASGSIFENPSSKPTSFSGNIFGHLSDVDSGAESSRCNDADDDSTDGEEEEESNAEPDEEKRDPTYKPDAEEPVDDPGTPPEETGPGIASAKKPANPELYDATSSKSTSLFNFQPTGTSGSSTPSGGLFDRISKDNNGNPIRQIATEDKENAGPSTGNILSASHLGASGGNNSFSNASKIPGDAAKSPGDNTWKPDTPIKFLTGPSPMVNVTAATPPQSSPFAGLFGNTSTPKAPSLFSGLNTNKPASVGFTFGGTPSAVSSLAPSGAASTTTSRATSPGATTDNDSTNEVGGDPDAVHHEQVDLTKGGAGEEDEDALHEVRAKALKFFPPKAEGGKSEWIAQGLGPLKVLKHKETGASRVLLRADPSGKVVLNKAVLDQVKYEATGKTIKLLTADDVGKGLETWLLQVKTEAMAKALAGILESSKSK